MNKYELNIISNHIDFNNKTLKKYNVDNIDTIGAFGDENFSIVFKNNTGKNVQVKLSMDGTDILTGKPASTEITKDMWLVNAYSSITLKAWPENNNGGAAFIFTSAKNSVASHLHGDMSSRGIIAAAVYEENYVEPERFYKSPYRRVSHNIGAAGGHLSLDNSKSIQNLNNVDCDSIDPSYRRETEELVSVGAGHHVDQKITYVQGLKDPKFAETVKVRFLWWDDLVAKLDRGAIFNDSTVGFPADKQHKLDLGSTPRIKSAKSIYSRV
jgi:hypothetical protein